MLTNRARGEARLSINGVERRLCLTLGALAEIENALQAPGLIALAARLKNLSANDLLILLAALLRGGGEDIADLGAQEIDLLAAANAIADCFASFE